VSHIKSLLWISVINHAEISSNYHNTNFCNLTSFERETGGTQKWSLSLDCFHLNCSKSDEEPRMYCCNENSFPCFTDLWWCMFYSRSINIRIKSDIKFWKRRTCSQGGFLSHVWINRFTTIILYLLHLPFISLIYVIPRIKYSWGSILCQVSLQLR